VYKSLLGKLFTAAVGLDVVDPLANYKKSRNIKGGLKFLNWSCYPDHTPFRGNFSPPGINPAILDPFAKFKERSFIHSRHIERV